MGLDSTGDYRLPTPPRESPRMKLRRWWRGRRSDQGIAYWMRFYGIPISAAFVALYCANGFVNGWSASYELTVTIRAPTEVDNRYLSWPLSVAGWLITPAIVGAVVGSQISRALADFRLKGRDEIITDFIDSGANRRGE